MRGAAMEILHSAGAGGGREVESVILMTATGPIARIGIKCTAEVNFLPSIPHDYVEYIKSRAHRNCRRAQLVVTSTFRRSSLFGISSYCKW